MNIKKATPIPSHVTAFFKRSNSTFRNKKYNFWKLLVLQKGFKWKTTTTEVPTMVSYMLYIITLYHQNWCSINGIVIFNPKKCLPSLQTFQFCSNTLTKYSKHSQYNQHSWHHEKMSIITISIIIMFGIIITAPFYCTLGWVNFSEFHITVCGSCKMSRKN